MRRPIVALPALALLSACATSGLAFVSDDSIDVVAPEDRAELTLPVTIRWEVDGDVEDVLGAGAFGVLVDRAPPPADKTLAWLFRGDDACEATPGCPDDEYLADRNVYATRETTIEISTVPRGSNERAFNEATVILLDGNGRRRGEAAWHVRFKVAER